MRKNLLSAVRLLIFLCAAPTVNVALAAEEPEFLVKVGSTYSDEGRGGAPTSFEARGVLARADSDGVERHYVLTAAHLVGGKDPYVIVKGQKLRPAAVCTDAEDDVAVLEIPVTDAKEAVWLSNPSGGLGVDTMEDSRLKLAPALMRHVFGLPGEPFFKIPSNSVTGPPAAQKYARTFVFQAEGRSRGARGQAGP
ncbi:MAG: hypothetical protein NDJ89_10790 [Oligoflexia bacterium]|nr:hypothetical protein [Oligoflexia bacterium]